MYKRHSSSEHDADRLCVQLREKQHRSNQHAALSFIESTLRVTLASDDLHKELQDGVILCKLVNCLGPGTITSIGGKNIPFVKMANISLFLQGARELGLHNSELFQTVDLYEAKDMGAVVNTILSLARLKKHSDSVDERTKTNKRSDRRRSFPRLLRSSNDEQKDASRRSPLLSAKQNSPPLEDDAHSGYRHVKSIFGQQPNVNDAQRVSRADISRIAEKAETLRKTYRSNMQQKPTTDSGYSTMAAREDEGECRRRRRLRRPNSHHSPFDASSGSSSSNSSADEEATLDTDSEEDKESKSAKEHRKSTGSNTSAMSDPISIHVVMQGEYNSKGHQHHHYLVVPDTTEQNEFDTISPVPEPSRSTPATLRIDDSQLLQSLKDDAPPWENAVEAKASRSDTLHPAAAKQKEATKVILNGEGNEANACYHLGNCIGKGQFGAVYRALDIHTGEIVAIKRIKIEDVDVDNEIMQEVDLLKGMDNPNIVHYLGSVQDESYLNIVLEYIENGSILSTLKAFGHLPEKLVASYTRKILCGLAYLHEHEVVHCDLKAANILTTKTGDVKLTDFGVSLNLRIKQDEMGAPAGTPNWMAPEIIELNGASTKSDIWSLGCTIVEMITGKPPYADLIAMSALYRIVEDDHPPIPEGISDSLQSFLRACFQKSPTDRPTAQELIQHTWLSPTSSPPVPPLTPSTSADELTISAGREKMRDRRSKYDDDDIDLSMIYEYMRANPTMDQQRVAAPNIRKKEVIEHKFVKTSFAKAITCKVCLVTVKRHAVFCEACALICHEKCRQNVASCRPIFPSTSPKQPNPNRRDSFPLPSSEPRTHNKLQKMLASLYL